jgi:hypothetical protein
MRCPFPGMDPYLERPTLWPDVHNGLVAAIRDALSPLVAPRYIVALERRVYHFSVGDLELMGIPDITVTRAPGAVRERPSRWPEDSAVIDVDVPMRHEMGETFLEVREVGSENVITVLELLSPANKIHAKGRARYLTKREEVLESTTHLVEIDLMRAGEAMRILRKPVASDYRILVSRAEKRPKAKLYPFGVRQAIPAFRLPLSPGDEEPAVDVGPVLQALYDRARFNLRLDCRQPPVPAFAPEDERWARELLATTHAS